MKFSIILPVYNVEKYLSTCIDSVLCQSYQDFEIILINDGSTDSSGVICEKYTELDSRITLIKQQNAGIACARNTGIFNSSGEYLVFLDSDDFIIRKDFLEKLSEKCDGLVDVVQYGYSKYYENQNRYVLGEIPPCGEHESLLEMLTSVLHSNSYGGCAWTKAVKRSLVIEKHVLFKPGMVALEDTDWFLSILCSAYSYSSIDSSFIAYRQREDSASHAPKIISLINNVWILEKWSKKVEQLFKNEDVSDLFKGILSYYYSNALILYTYYERKDREPFRKVLMAYSFLLNKAITPRAITIKRVYSLLGFDMTIFLLQLLRSVKL